LKSEISLRKISIYMMRRKITKKLRWTIIFIVH